MQFPSSFLSSSFLAGALAIIAVPVALFGAQFTDEASTTPDLEDSVYVFLDAGFDDLDDLADDEGFLRLSRQLAHYQLQSGTEELDFDALRDSLLPAYDSVELDGPEFRYVVVPFEGEFIIVCRLVEGLIVDDSSLSRQVTIRQEVDTVF